MTDKIPSFQTPLGRARGLGSAHTGLSHWIRQRVTAIVIGPLLVWAVFGMLTHGTNSFADAHAWVAQPLTAIGLIVLIATVFWHAKLGLQVVIEDYLHDIWGKRLALLANAVACPVFALAGIFAVLKIALGI